MRMRTMPLQRLLQIWSISQIEALETMGVYLVRQCDIVGWHSSTPNMFTSDMHHITCTQIPGEKCFVKICEDLHSFVKLCEDL